MHGNYLICPDSDPQNPKIYLLVNVEGDTIGICFNRDFTCSEEETAIVEDHKFPKGLQETQVDQ